VTPFSTRKVVYLDDARRRFESVRGLSEELLQIRTFFSLYRAATGNEGRTCPRFSAGSGSQPKL
jgi:hypothetical protein